QMGDQGSLFTADGAEFTVDDTVKRLEDIHVHIGTLRCGKLARGDTVDMRVDGGRRKYLRANHSVTHLLHAALRNYLGDHVAQKGSLVSPGHLRFDFSHPKAVSREELVSIELEVNARIRENASVVTRQMTPNEAQEAGAVALFGEKYGEEVRVVSMGSGITDSDSPYSMELCGGTHVARTGDIGIFKITSEAAVAAGVRRIEAKTGDAALEHIATREAIVVNAAKALNASPGDVPTRVSALLEERRSMEREMAELRRRIAEGGGANPVPEIRDVNGISIATRLLDDVPAKELKPLVDSLKRQINSGVVAVVAVSEGKASLVVGVTDDLTGRVNAIDLVRAGSNAVGGKGGGGRPDMAQAGGPDGAAGGEALKAIVEALALA
ncbi:MAG: hypothetical protein CFH10_02384, partial [Alphaproteobacteria bacterium MarineAlpha4_Bin2]